MNNATQKSAIAHTPGPWTVEDPFDTENLAIVQSGLQSFDWGIIGTVCIDMDAKTPIDLPTQQANARLIAATPELLGALTAIRPTVADLAGQIICPVDNTFSRMLAVIDAAIAKATQPEARR